MTTPKFVLALLSALTVSICSAQSSPIEPTPRDPDSESLLALPWKSFDQTQNSGWRVYVNPTRKQYLEAAKLIEAYLDRHAELTPRQRALCHYHAAHQYIYRAVLTGVGDPLDALPHLEKAIVPSKETAPSLDWNEMVIATKAFLMGD